MTKDNRLFGTDGVRGKANYYPMTVEVALALGRAAGALFRCQHEKSRVVVGKDTRVSCYMFENALIAGLCSMGIDTLMVGPLPTPGVAFITRAYRADAGVVISASHNGFEDNGIKFFDSQGFKIEDTFQQKIEELVFNNHFDAFVPHHREIGKNTRVVDADGRYIEHVKSTFSKNLTLKGLKIALDCAHGAAHRVAPMIFKELDAQLVAEVGVKPDGYNINLDCGSVHLETIRKAVLESGADVGIALDGDADRVIMIDERGETVDGDTILGICALHLKSQGLLKNNKVVGTVMSNYGLVQTMKEANIEFISAPVGDRYVIQAMLAEDAVLGGEQSGHVICLDYNTTGDGLVGALQVLKMMIQTGSSLSVLADKVRKYPQSLVNVQVKYKIPLGEVSGLEALVKKAEKELTEQGRVLLRYSGTENIMRVMVEGPKESQVSAMAKSIAQHLQKKLGV